MRSVLQPVRRALSSEVALFLYVGLLFAVSVILAWNVVRTGGIESSNRKIICDSRKLREAIPPETALERAQLRNALQNVRDCR